jgi:hypothetical protein
MELKMLFQEIDLKNVIHQELEVQYNTKIKQHLQSLMMNFLKLFHLDLSKRSNSSSSSNFQLVPFCEY